MSKTEEKLKLAVKEYLEDKQRDIASNIINIFVWGFVFGVLFAYANVAPLIIGIVIGYALAKKELPFIDYYIIKFFSMIDYKKLKIITKESNTITEIKKE